MQVTGEKGIGSILKVILQVCFWGGIAILILIPIILLVMGEHIGGAFIYVLCPNGIAMLVIVKQFIGLFDSLKENKPFSNNTVKRLKKASIASLVMAILFVIQTIYEFFLVKANIVFCIGLGFLVVLFFGVSIALYILSELFRQANEYKSENDLTI